MQIFLRRFKNALSYVSGRSIVIGIDGDKVTVDAGRVSGEEVKTVARAFYKGTLQIQNNCGEGPGAENGEGEKPERSSRTVRRRIRVLV